MAEVKRYYRWCDRCDKVTEHTKAWDLFGHNSLACRVCVPEDWPFCVTPPFDAEGSLRNPKPILREQLDGLIRNAKQGVYGTLGGNIVPYADPIYLIDDTYYKIVKAVVA